MASDSNSFVQPAIPRFDGHYDHWSMLMENFLRSKEYWDIVENGVTEPVAEETLTEAQNKALADRKLKDFKAKNYLFQAIDRSILETILQKDTSKHIWDSMKKKYSGTARVKRAQLQALTRDFETLQMKSGESVTEFFGRTMGIANKMRFHGAVMEDVKVVEKILRSMTSKWNYVVCSIEESKDVEHMSIDELQSSLLVHEQKLNRENNEEQTALKASTEFSGMRGRGRGRSGRGRGRGGRGNRDSTHISKRDDNSQEKEKGKYDKSKIKCYRCRYFGHYKNECYTKLPKETGEKSNFSEKKNEEETLLMAFHALQEPDQETWYMDTGCSNHMSGCKSSLLNLNEDFRYVVSFGDKSTVNVMGKGDIQIRTRNGSIEIISNVFYIPDLKTNLLSAGQLQDKCYKITIFKGECEVYGPKRGSIAIIKMTSNRLFPLKIKTVPACLFVKEDGLSWRWHHRYGHLNFNGLKTLHQKQMVIGLPLITPP
nr:TPA_asm: hypothetical protein HUJ06_018195 [Nelumbo nucifera]